MRFAIFPYKVGSNSASQLARALGCKQIKHEGNRFNKWNHPGYWVINYGSSRCPTGHSVLNASINVARAGNKLQFFELVKDHCRVPEYTTSKDTASQWFSQGRKIKVVCRQTLTGHSGQGIVIAAQPDQLVDAPLYTRYIPKDAEYRLHFIKGQIEPFFIQRKARRTTDYPEGESNNLVRNHANGWVYCHEPDNVGVIPDDVLTQAKAAFEYSHLDFGGVDCIWSKKQGRAYILEINTACGLEGATVEAYANAFRSLERQ